MSRNVKNTARLQRPVRSMVTLIQRCRAQAIPFVPWRWVRRARDTPSSHCLGGGAYGDAFLVRHPDVPSKRLVVKHFRGHQIELVRELEALLRVQDVSGVQRLVGVCLDTNEIITEYAGNTLLQEVLLWGLSMKDKLWVTYQVLAIVDRLHKKGLCHNDLKPNNICVCRTPSGPYKVTLIDFGLVRTTCSVVLLRAADRPNERYPWMSPEVAGRGPCSPASDVYSLGVLIFGLFDHRFIPFKIRRWGTLAMSQQARDRPSLQDGLDIIKDLLSQVLRSSNKHPRGKPSLQTSVRASTSPSLAQQEKRRA